MISGSRMYQAMVAKGSQCPTQHVPCIVHTAFVALSSRVTEGPVSLTLRHSQSKSCLGWRRAPGWHRGDTKATKPAVVVARAEQPQ